jgi:hypothetical protein
MKSGAHKIKPPVLAGFLQLLCKNHDKTRIEGHFGKLTSIVISEYQINK